MRPIITDPMQNALKTIEGNLLDSIQDSPQTREAGSRNAKTAIGVYLELKYDCASTQGVWRLESDSTAFARVVSGFYSHESFQS